MQPAIRGSVYKDFIQQDSGSQTFVFVIPLFNTKSCQNASSNKLKFDDWKCHLCCGSKGTYFPIFYDYKLNIMRSLDCCSNKTSNLKTLQNGETVVGILLQLYDVLQTA